MDPYDRRMYRRMYRRQNPLRGLAGGIFIIFLALAFFVSGASGHLFLPLLFVGLALCALIGSISTLNPRGIYSGLHGFIWLLGIGICFLIGFWPWILVVIGVSMILGALTQPIMAGLLGAGFMLASQQVPPYQPTYTVPPQQPPSGMYQEGGAAYPYPPEQPPAGPTAAPPAPPLDPQS